jgi:hypothetical protein
LTENVAFLIDFDPNLMEFDGFLHARMRIRRCGKLVAKKQRRELGTGNGEQEKGKANGV